MSKKDDALRLALEALEGFKNPDLSPQDSFEQCELAITAIREALAEQPAQGCEFCSHPLYAGTKCKNCGKPAQRTWVGLTEEETGHWAADFLAGAKWAEAKLREKNT